MPSKFLAMKNLNLRRDAISVDLSRRNKEKENKLPCQCILTNIALALTSHFGWLLENS